MKQGRKHKSRLVTSQKSASPKIAAPAPTGESTIVEEKENGAVEAAGTITETAEAVKISESVPLAKTAEPSTVSTAEHPAAVKPTEPPTSAPIKTAEPPAAIAAPIKTASVTEAEVGGEDDDDFAPIKTSQVEALKAQAKKMQEETLAKMQEIDQAIKLSTSMVENLEKTTIEHLTNAAAMASAVPESTAASIQQPADALPPAPIVTVSSSPKESPVKPTSKPKVNIMRRMVRNITAVPASAPAIPVPPSVPLKTDAPPSAPASAPALAPASAPALAAASMVPEVAAVHPPKPLAASKMPIRSVVPRERDLDRQSVQTKSSLVSALPLPAASKASLLPAATAMVNNGTRIGPLVESGVLQNLDNDSKKEGFSEVAGEFTRQSSIVWNPNERSTLHIMRDGMFVFDIQAGYPWLMELNGTNIWSRNQTNGHMNHVPTYESTALLQLKAGFKLRITSDRRGTGSQNMTVRTSFRRVPESLTMSQNPLFSLPLGNAPTSSTAPQSASQKQAEITKASSGRVVTSRATQ